MYALSPCLGFLSADNRAMVSISASFPEAVLWKSN
jgi:hypothetical protein